MEKIDKRTKEYRDSQVGDTVLATDEGFEAAAEVGIEKGNERTGEIIRDARLPIDPVIHMLDEILTYVKEIHQHITHPLLAVDPATNKISRPVPPKKPVGDLTKCMKCEKDLPKTETLRTVQELCHSCVWRNG